MVWLAKNQHNSRTFVHEIGKLNDEAQTHSDGVIDDYYLHRQIETREQREFIFLRFLSV